MSDAIHVGDRVEACEGEHFGVEGRVTGFTRGGRVIVQPDSGATVAVVPCNLALVWEGQG